MGITRRNLTKGIVLLSTALAVAPFGALYKYLSVPVPTIKLEKTKITNKKDLPPGQAIRFNYPTSDRPAILIHVSPGEYEYGDYRQGSQTKALNTDEFVAYDGICVHLGCPVNWNASQKADDCPCHGAAYSPIDGSVLKGPPLRPLPKIKLEIDESGDIYAAGYESGLPLFGLENVNFEPVQ
jgi:arsenite oxidase small subunit